MRTLIKDLSAQTGTEVTIKGWVDVRRDQGKMIFFDFRDRTGKVQGVVLPKSAAMDVAKEVRSEYIVAVTANVNKRPDKNINDKVQNGDIELEIVGLEVLSAPQELPFEREADVNLDTCLDYRPYTFRSEANKAIFALQAAILQEYRASLMRQKFTEFIAPAIVGADAEGGAAVFTLDYFGHKAHLATSPQFAKQIMTGAFERVFTIAKIFRAEKSTTTRHISELTQMDFEMGFIENELEVLAVLEQVIRDVVLKVGTEQAHLFEQLGVPVPKLGKKFPILTVHEALAKIGAPAADDPNPEQERAICEWALKEHDTDFVFITRFPTKARAFYTYEDPTEAPYSRGFDLLFRGLEINSGAQRIHKYHDLVARIKERGLKPENFSFYLQAFKYGMPPHGGCSTGLERLTMKMLNLPNVKEATAFPRDMHRIDTLLSRDSHDK
jgi:nondiscriminating aspartyl-tRNA synthetase